MQQLTPACHRYLIADYERQNFSVSQCKWDANTQSHIVAIKPPGYNTPSPHHGLSAGAIAGTVIGCVAFFVLLVLLGIWLKRRKRPQPTEQVPILVQELDAKEKDPFTPDDDPDKTDFARLRHAELDTVEHKGHEIDGQPQSPAASEVAGVEQQRFELDATERRSRTLSSPISALSASSSPTKLHRRGLSDPVSVTTERSDTTSEQSEPVPPAGGTHTPQSRSRSFSRIFHQRQLSDPISTRSDQSDTIPEHHNEHLSGPISPISESPTSPRRTRSLATRLHKREPSDPVSLASEPSEDAIPEQQSHAPSFVRTRSDTTGLHRREISDPDSVIEE